MMATIHQEELQTAKMRSPRESGRKSAFRLLSVPRRVRVLIAAPSG
jgi:hypothetical protein